MSKPTAIVLGAAVWPGGQPSPALRRRAEKAAALYHAGEVAAIVGTGGHGRHPPSEAEVIRDVLTAAGVPESAVTLEDRSRTTRENLAFARALLPPDEPVLIVSDFWHLPRARLIALRLGLNTRTARADLAGSAPHRVLRLMLREAGALVWELLRPPLR